MSERKNASFPSLETPKTAATPTEDRSLVLKLIVTRAPLHCAKSSAMASDEKESEIKRAQMVFIGPNV